MPGAPSDLISTHITVESLTVTAGPVRGDRDLTAAIAEEMGLLDATEETTIKARGEGNLRPFDSLWKRRGERELEGGRGDKSYVSCSGTNIIEYESENNVSRCIH